MSESVSVRRLVENEVVFREYNENIQQGLDELKQIAKKDEQEHLVPDHDAMTLHFYCECSDENCLERVRLTPKRYEQIHHNRRQFVIVCGHEVDQIEHVLKEEDGYCIVEKFLKPPAKANGLNSTPITNV